MQLTAYLQILKRRKWVVVVTLTVALAAAAVISTQLPATYQATATLRILTATSGSADYLQYDVRYAERLMNTYANVATSQPVLAELARQMSLAEPPKATVTMITNTELLQVTVEDRDPARARDAANLLSGILIAEAKARYGELSTAARDTLTAQLALSETELKQAQQAFEAALSADYPDAEQIQILRDTLTLREARYTTLLAQYERVRVLVELQAPSISVLEPATLPDAPSQPQALLILGLAGLLGLAGGLGLAFLFEALDSRVYSKEQIAALTGLPILGEIPTLPRRQRGGFYREHSIQQEAVHRLTVSLFPPESIRDRRPARRVLLVAGALRGDGASTLTANLGLALARSGRRTLLIDADARAPALHRLFKLPNDIGLNNLLAGEIDLSDAIHSSEFQRLFVLSSGPWSPEFFARLGSMGAADLRSTLTNAFDVILIDSPAFLAVADAAVLASMADSVLWVICPGRIRRGAISSMLQQLIDLNVRPIEIVLNRFQSGDAYDTFHSYRRAVRRAPQPAKGAAIAPRSARSVRPSQADAAGKERDSA